MNAISNFLGNLKTLISAATAKQPEDSEKNSFALLVEQNTNQNPEDVAIICEGETLSWNELNERANRVASQLKAQGIKKGDCVSLFMQNRTEFLTCMIGITKLGAITGMINTNLTSTPLSHCINLIDSKKCIFGAEQTESLSGVKNELNLKDGEDYLFVQDKEESPLPNWAHSLDSKDASVSSANPDETKEVCMGDVAFYIFTSGTTGLPKAAVLSHKRMLVTGGMAVNMLLRLKSTDRMYNCLPLYHGTGLMVGLTAAFLVGASSVIRRRFSASAFWNDINEHRCTSFVYIGELIRYLLSRPPENMDKSNLVRTIIGNGLRPDIWMEFKERFDIERIGEFYGASEGNGGFANVLNKNCTVGMGVAPAKLVAYDVANDEIVRDENGFCIEVSKGDPGLLLMEVTDKSKFEGYTNSEATEKKLLKNALVEGDVYFNSGDIMKIIDVGFSFGQNHYQFVDRVGDTFRWKGENVSTSEVAEVINQSAEVEFANVYGVELPGTDGKAGMAAIILKEGAKSSQDIDLESLSADIISHLPNYARPLFLKIEKEMPTTSTHKLQKNVLRKEAFHLDKVSDELLVMKPGDEVYSLLNREFYDKIMNKEVSF